VQFFWVHFTGNAVKEALKKYKLNLFPYVHKISINNHIDARFKSLFDGFALKDAFRESDLSALFDRLLIEIGRVLSTEGTGIGRLHKSVRYLNENFSENIKMTELAKMENMCMTTFNLHFKKYVGVTPTKYIIKLRMQLAVDLLLNSDLTIQEIASRCGYNDYNFFTKIFKNEFGMPPTKYRIGYKR
jgi:AraC-like DNA-binding protein